MSLVAEIVTVLTPAITLIVFLIRFDLSRPLLGITALALLIAGTLQIHRSEQSEAKQPVRALRAGFGRLCVVIGAAQLFAVFVAPPLYAALVGALASGFVLGVGLRPARPHFEGKRGYPRARTGLLVVAIVAVSFVSYAGIAIAIWAGQGNHADRQTEADPAGGASQEEAEEPPASEGDEDPPPTYAESCPALPDPIAIGHGLGQLFKREGEPRAGCGQEADLVESTGAWVAPGLCSGSLRSVAVAGASGPPAILYGESAEFAWEQAEASKLVRAETAEPGAGDVDLIVTLDGTYGFTRSTRSLTPGKEELRDCDEATGIPRPFTRLPPTLLLLWRELLKREASWSWPEPDPADPSEPIAFVGYPVPVTAATGGCDGDTSCRLVVDGKLWPAEGTAYVSVSELEPYMPPHTS